MVTVAERGEVGPRPRDDHSREPVRREERDVISSTFRYFAAKYALPTSWIHQTGART